MSAQDIVIIILMSPLVGGFIYMNFIFPKQAAKQKAAEEAKNNQEKTK